MKMNVKIGKKVIGENFPSLFIAEAGINHNGDIKLAKKLVKTAKECGADAVKFQTFSAEDLISHKSKYFRLFKKLELKDNDFAELSDYAKKQNILFLSTPFSNRAVNLLTKLKVPAFKIASGDLTNLPLIEYASSKLKPIILSTGMSDLNEIQDAIKSIKKMKNNKIILMHSVSSYPTPHNETNLKVIEKFKAKFPFPVGYSDNGSDTLVPVIAVAMGAKIIEKHFTINKKLEGPDHKLSANPSELKNIIQKIRKTEEMMGDGKKKCQPSELQNRVNARRSLTAKVNIEKNSEILPEMISLNRPSTGIEPKFLKKILYKRIKKSVKAGDSIRWEYL